MGGPLVPPTPPGVDGDIPLFLPPLLLLLLLLLPIPSSADAEERGGCEASQGGWRNGASAAVREGEADRNIRDATPVEKRPWARCVGEELDSASSLVTADTAIAPLAALRRGDGDNDEEA